MVRKVTLKSQQQHQNQQKGKGRVQKQKSQFVKKWVVQKIISSRKNQYEHYPGYQDELDKQKQQQQEEQKKQMEKLNKDRQQVKKLQKQRKNKIDKQKLNKIMKANQIQIVVKNQTQSNNIIKQTSTNKNEQKTEQFSASKTRQGTKFHDSQKITQNKDQKKTAKKDPKKNTKQQNKQQILQSTKTEKKTPIQQQKITKKIQKTVKKKQDAEKTKNNYNNNIINSNNNQKTKKKQAISSPQPRAKELNEFINQGKFKTWQQQQQQQLQQQNGKYFKQNENESESEQIINQISESECEFEDEDEENEQSIGQNTQQKLKELQDYLNNQEENELSEDYENQEQNERKKQLKKHTKYSPKKDQNKNDSQIQQVRRSPRLHKEIENESKHIDSKQNKKDCQKKLFIKKCEEEEQEEELLNVDQNKNINKQKQKYLQFDQIDIEEQKLNQKIKNIDDILEKCKKIQQKSRKDSKNQDQINNYNENGQSVLTFKTPLKKNNSNIILKKQNSAFSISSLDSATNFNNKNQNFDNNQKSNIILNNSNIISENELTKNLLNYKKFNREAVKQNFIIDSPFVSEQNLDFQNKNYNQNQQQLQQSHIINDSNDQDIQEIKKNSYLVNLTKKQDKNQEKWTKNYFSKESIYSPLTNKYNEQINLQKQIKPIKNGELNSDEEQEQETENQSKFKNDKFTKQNQKNHNILYSQTSSSSSEKFIDNNIEEEIKEEEEKLDQQQNLSKLKDFQNQIEDINLLRNCKNLQLQIDELHQYALNMKQIGKKKSPLFKNNLNKSLNISSKLNQYNTNNNKNSNNFVQNVDVAFCIDATKGMEEYIEQTQNIIFTLFQKCLKKNIDLKIALVFYRDHPPEEESFVTKYTDCTNNITNLIQFLKSIGGAQGGGDIPEAVLDGLYDSLKKVNWRASAQKYIIHIGDAPPHGDFYTGQLSIFNRSFMWRDGCPCGLTIEKIAKLINNYKFRYRLVKIGDNLQLMSKIFKQNIQDFKEIKINSSKNLDKYISGMIISETCFFEDIE
ncbi:hypothetical protein PPERSA_10708 [Pseudocohnilembus persalinus]|uniref:VWFA domain-containing protein n=1 Tax=Pseudocohnilembus persalinus TaxID=266149 RepID=A0A0V0QDC3_PSEPJ|nr:hypothetical protein PPERSA_10708 [Pseudocohnilembus persalinus]|eukprot:KRX00209.1 hypothetical protein PPERSA_10708 [Pseudocohnilembus persalinus]